ncbi:MAG: O-antigen ligase family protein, partial [Lysobacter sp.]|nr:O-antigen ligase family protein [Lysobacter sp.]
MLFLLTGFLVVFAPLVMGGNRPTPLLVLEVAAVAGLAALAWNGTALASLRLLPMPLRLGIGLLVIYPLLQLVPLPLETWAQLPGRAPYFGSIELAGAPAVDSWRPLSIHPRATEYSWLVVLPCLAAFLLMLAQPRVNVRRLVTVFVGVAIVEAILGISQLGASPGSAMYLGNIHGGGAATGTYVNRNHFAALMAMALPMALVLWFLQTQTSLDSNGVPLRVHPRLRDRRRALQIGLALPVLFLLVALAFSMSRGGIGAGLLAFSLASLALVPRAHTFWAKIAYGVIGGGAIAFSIYIGLTPVLERFAPDNLEGGFQGRVAIAAASFRAAMDFLPFGSGLGTFADVFRRYQADTMPGFVDYAHNDYAQLFLELGVAGAAVIVLLGVAYAMRWVELARVWRERTHGHLQMAAGLGMLAMIVHGLVDFNFHI